MQALDELVARWRKNPDSDATLALCAHLGTNPHGDLMREVGDAAEAWHRDNHEVMLSVGLMFLDAGLLEEARVAMVHAAQLDTRGGQAYRHLGEILLRLGEAAKSGEVLARALELGSDDPDTRLWYERALLFRALEQRRGAAAVAHEIARTAPKGPPYDDVAPAPRLSAARPMRGRSDARRSRPPAAPAAALARRSSPPAAGRRQPSVQPKTQPLHTLPLAEAPAPVIPRVPRQAPASERRGIDGNGPPSPPRPTLDARSSVPRSREHEAAPPSAERAAPSSDVARSQRRASPAPPAAASEALPPHEAPTFEIEPARAALDATRAREVGDDTQPAPDAVLEALAQVGIFEPESGVTPAWEAAPRVSSRRTWVLAGAVVAALALAVGGYSYGRKKQTERALEAAELEQRIGAVLANALSDASAAEPLFTRLFELESRSPTAAKLWVLDRVQRVLTSDEPVAGLESALVRARTVGVPEPELVFGSIASAVAEGDLASAARLVERWDADARVSDDPYYQLLAGVVLERAGDPRALERYERARASKRAELAHVLAAQLAIVQLAPEEAKAIVASATSALGAQPTTRVLDGLAWAAAGAASPAPTPLTEAEQAGLPPAVRAAARAVAAVIASQAGDASAASKSFEQAVARSTSPVLATWIGEQALSRGELGAARSAALRAAELSAIHQPARELATRVALAEGRLTEAHKLAEALDGMSEVPLAVRAASAYELLDGAALASELASLPAAALRSPSLGALARARRALEGKGFKTSELEQSATPRQAWGAFIALDAALDNGQLDWAAALVKGRRWERTQAPVALRVARLARYRGEQNALELAAPVLDAAHHSPRHLVEGVLALVDNGRVDEAEALVSEAAARAGRLAPWLNALVEAARGDTRAASARLAKVSLPTDDAPLLERSLAARALTKAADRRAKSYVASLLARHPRNPELALAKREARAQR